MFSGHTDRIYGLNGTFNQIQALGITFNPTRLGDFFTGLYELSSLGIVQPCAAPTQLLSEEIRQPFGMLDMLETVDRYRVIHTWLDLHVEIIPPDHCHTPLTEAGYLNLLNYHWPNIFATMGQYYSSPGQISPGVGFFRKYGLASADPEIVMFQPRNTKARIENAREGAMVKTKNLSWHVKQEFVTAGMFENAMDDDADSPWDQQWATTNITGGLPGAPAIQPAWTFAMRASGETQYTERDMSNYLWSRDGHETTPSRIDGSSHTSGNTIRIKIKWTVKQRVQLKGRKQDGTTYEP